jgi:hypothetical protein
MQVSEAVSRLMGKADLLEIASLAKLALSLSKCMLIRNDIIITDKVYFL